MRSVLPIAVAALLVSAGCAGWGSDATTTEPDGTEIGPDGTTTEDDPSIAVTGAEFPVDADEVFQRVQALLDEDVPEPTRIRVLRVQPSNRTYELSTDEFTRTMGIRQRESKTSVGGNAHDGVRILYANESSPKEMEQVLAHEFAHVAQPTTLWQDVSARQGNYSGTTDARIVRDAVREGAATYLADEYTERYLSGIAEQSAYPEWESFSPGTKWHLSPYRFGARYVRDRVDSPGSLTGVYDDPPVTSEQLLHNYTAETEPSRNLTVVSDTAGSPWNVTRRDTKGELFVRVALAEHIGESRAETAASGWGNDCAITYTDGNRTAHAWVLRWDDDRNGTEFERSLAAYLDARAHSEESSWVDGGTRFRLRRVDSRTVALLAGDHSAVREIGVAETGSNVTVAVGGRSD